MTVLHHTSIDVHGVLDNWSDRQLKGMFRDANGRKLSALEVRKVLIEHLTRGQHMISLGDCDNFDPKSGCLGHPKGA